MNQIVSLNTASTLTMSSREIAELTGKRHDHVMRDIRSMLVTLQINGPTFGGVYVDAKGEARSCFNLPKRETLILVSGYSVELRARILNADERAKSDLGRRSTNIVSAKSLLLGGEQSDVSSFGLNEPACCGTSATLTGRSQRVCWNFSIPQSLPWPTASFGPIRS